MTAQVDEPTLRIVVLRSGLELTRLAATPGGSTFVETYRPAVGAVVQLPQLQAEAIVRNHAGDIYTGQGTAP